MTITTSLASATERAARTFIAKVVATWTWSARSCLAVAAGMPHEQALFPALQYSLTSTIVSLVAQIGGAVGRLSAHEAAATSLRLRRINRIRDQRGRGRIKFL